MCGGFTCSKNSLIALNILYVVVAITLISVAAYAKFASIVTSISLVSGITTCGVFLLLISIVGIIAACKHHQVLLFFYMIILFLIFIIQFSVACACLAINKKQQEALALQGWKLAGKDLIHKAQVRFHCCGYTGFSRFNETDCTGVTNKDSKECCPKEDLKCCINPNKNATSHCMCEPCNSNLQHVIGDWLSTVGGIGLFFSFTEIIGGFIAKRFRHEFDPRANIQSLLHN